MTYIPKDLRNLVKEVPREIPIVVITVMKKTRKITFSLNEPFLKNLPYFTDLQKINF